jgi:HTH-type transcriptional regulator/antitoxin HipB
MLLRRPHDLSALFRDGRARSGWSQTDLADRIGVSRQWISQVETGKTSVEFDLVVGGLQALGYQLHVDILDPGQTDPRSSDRAQPPTHGQSQRTPLTRDGKTLSEPRVRRRSRQDRDD